MQPSTNPLIYIAGPYAPKLGRSVDFNIGVANAYGREICGWDLEVDVLVPHNFHSHWEDIRPDPTYFYKFDLRLLILCDAIFMLPGWERSDGARIEHQFAIQNSIDVFCELDVLRKWLESRNPRKTEDG